MWLRIRVLTRVGSLLELLDEWILNSPRISGGDPVVDALQLRHLRLTVRDGLDVDGDAIGPQDK